MDKAAYRLAHDSGLIGHFHHLDAVRQLRRALRHARVQRLAKIQHIASGCHRNRKPDGRLSVHAKLRHRRLGRLAAHGGDIGQRNVAATDMQRHGAQALLRGERAADADRDVISCGAQRSGRLDGILRLQGVTHLCYIKPHPGELTGRKGDNYLLLRLAEQRNFAHVI